VSINNLPPDSKAETQDKVKLVIDLWTRREQLEALSYLYCVCGCKIDDIHHQISLALEAEAGQKAVRSWW